MSISKQAINNPSVAGKEQFWNEHIKLRHASSLSRAEYCRQHGIICSQFSYWEHKLKSCGSGFSSLLPVKLNPDNITPSDAEIKCTLKLKGGHELKIHDEGVLPLLFSLLS